MRTKQEPRDRLYDVTGNLTGNLTRDDAKPSQVIRVDETGKTSSGIAQPFAEGRPLPTDARVIVRDEHGFHTEPLGGQGPAQVATDAYRRGWDSIFATRQKAGSA